MAHMKICAVLLAFLCLAAPLEAKKTKKSSNAKMYGKKHHASNKATIHKPSKIVKRTPIN
jgi:hypothetical protein